MKNSSGDSVITGKLISDNPVTIEIDVLSGSEDCQDNIQCLSDLGYGEQITESISKRENVEQIWTDCDWLNNNIEVIISESVRISSRNKYENSVSEDDLLIKDTLQIFTEFFGPIIDARDTK